MPVGRAPAVPVQQVDPGWVLGVGGHAFAGLPLPQRVEGFHRDGHRPAAGLAERTRLIHARPAVERQRAVWQSPPARAPSAAYADGMT